MKFLCFHQLLVVVESLPVRGAWIEMISRLLGCANDTCRSPCGERGLKCHKLQNALALSCRSPCGERGLKSLSDVAVFVHILGSLPVRGAWIEIMLADTTFQRCDASLPVRGAWIEIGMQSGLPCCCCGRSPCGERGLK